jgi:hypothetical protein
MLEALIEDWTDELEIFLVLERWEVDEGEGRGMLLTGHTPRTIRRITLRAGKSLK